MVSERGTEVSPYHLRCIISHFCGTEKPYRSGLNNFMHKMNFIRYESGLGEKMPGVRLVKANLLRTNFIFQILALDFIVRKCEI
jgi:hypothetical protein